MTPDIAITLAITAGMLVLCVGGWWRVEVAGLLAMTAAIVTGVVTPEQGVAGFANPAVLTVALVLGLSVGLLRTGAVDALGRLIQRYAGQGELAVTVALLVIVVPASALINNTAAVAVLLPMVLGLARSANLSASRLLMPLSFGSQLGGTLTLIGTSTNLLVAGVVIDAGLPEIGLFDITLPGLVLAAVGCTYLLTIGRKLTPHRVGPVDDSLGRGLRAYISEIELDESSDLVGSTVAEGDLPGRYEVEVLAVRRRGRGLIRDEDLELRPGDHLLVRGEHEQIARLTDAEHAALLTSTPPLDDDEAPKEGDLRIAEMMIPPRSRIRRRPLGVLRRQLPGDVVVLGLEHGGQRVTERLAEQRVAAGDVLLVRAPLDRLQGLHEAGDLMLLGVLELPPRRVERMPLAVGIVLAVVGLTALGVFPILVSALLGMVAMLMTGCARPQEVYEELDWGVVILLGSLLGVGAAIQASGTAGFLTGGALGAMEAVGPLGVLALLYLFTSVLTELITNNAAAIVIAPLAIEAAAGLEVSPMPYLVAVMFAASNSFATPIGYQTNTFIYGPGGYRFTDFLRVGGPLVLLMAVVATVVLPLFFPF